jgi:hypothetical protein
MILNKQNSDHKGDPYSFLAYVKSNTISLIGIALIFICYLLFIYKYSYNVPLWDEYDTNLGFLTSWQTAVSWHEKLNILFMQHNEHRMVFNHIIVLDKQVQLYD